MAIIYETQGLYDQALEIYNSVLETKVRVIGHDHPARGRAMSYGNMGYSLGEAEEAKEMFTKTYSISEIEYTHEPLSHVPIIPLCACALVH